MGWPGRIMVGAVGSVGYVPLLGAVELVTRIIP